MGDFNGDGRQDPAVLADIGSNDVSILLRQGLLFTDTDSDGYSYRDPATATKPGQLSKHIHSAQHRCGGYAGCHAGQHNEHYCFYLNQLQRQARGLSDTGVVRVTDAHPAGTYTITVRPSPVTS